MSRAWNFGAGPGTLPEPVLEQIKQDLPEFKGSGASIMEHSHRGKVYGPVHDEAIANVRELLKVPDDYAILLLQGGATAQFGLIPMNLLHAGETADYINTGEWSHKAIEEAKLVGNVHVAADTAAARPCTLPGLNDMRYSAKPVYVHITSNETISGTQWAAFPKAPAPLVADMSSDILSRPLDVKPFGLIYAGAQKNLGPSGVVLVIIRKDLAAKAPANLPKIFRYSTQMENNSMVNTPPTLAIYVLALVTRWLKAQGGVEGIAKVNAEKAKRLYAAIDGSKLYQGCADKHVRSVMNVTWKLAKPDLEKPFLAEAEKAGLMALAGHRSVGGCRASIYNAMPLAGVDALVKFMADFERRNP